MMAFKNLFTAIFLFSNLNLSFGVSIPNLLRRYHVDSIPYVLRLSKNTPVHYLHPPHLEQVQLQYIGKCCPKEIRCYTDRSARDPLRWNCTVNSDSIKPYVVVPKKSYVEGWESEDDKEYINLDSLTLIVHSLDSVKIPPI